MPGPARPCLAEVPASTVGDAPTTRAGANCRTGLWVVNLSTQWHQGRLWGPCDTRAPSPPAVRLTTQKPVLPLVPHLTAEWHQGYLWCHCVTRVPSPPVVRLSSQRPILPLVSALAVEANPTAETGTSARPAGQARPGLVWLRCLPLRSGMHRQQGQTPTAGQASELSSLP